MAMKTVWGVIILFLLVMATVTTVAYKRTSGSTGIDPAQIAKMRQ